MNTLLYSMGAVNVFFLYLIVFIVFNVTMLCTHLYRVHLFQRVQPYGMLGGSPHGGSMFTMNPYADMYGMHAAGQQMSAAMNQMYGNYGSSTDPTAAMMGQSAYGQHQLSPGNGSGTPFLGGAAITYNGSSSCAAVPCDYSPPAGNHPSCSAAASMGALSAAANNATAATYSSMFNSLYERSSISGSTTDAENNCNYPTSHQTHQQHHPQNQLNWTAHQNHTDQGQPINTDSTLYGSAHQRLQSPYPKHSENRSTSEYKTLHGTYVPPPHHTGSIKQQPISPSGSTGSIHSLSPASSDQSPYHAPSHLAQNTGAPLVRSGMLTHHGIGTNSYNSVDTHVTTLSNRGW